MLESGYSWLDQSNRVFLKDGLSKVAQRDIISRLREVPDEEIQGRWVTQLILGGQQRPSLIVACRRESPLLRGG